MTEIHDSTTCTLGPSGQPCWMCRFAAESPGNRSELPSKASEPENHPAGFLASEPKSPPQVKYGAGIAIPAPDFDREWREAPRGMTNYVERSVAEYFYLRGRRAGELNQMIEENRVFREMAERRGLTK